LSRKRVEKGRRGREDDGLMVKSKKPRLEDDGRDRGVYILAGSEPGRSRPKESLRLFSDDARDQEGEQTKKRFV
jgi:hypothetical protein